MARLVVIRLDGVEAILHARTDRSLMEVIRDAGFDELEAQCGGACSCATCHVHVDPLLADRLAPIGAAEDELLDCVSHRVPQSRLSCQIPFTAELDGLRVAIAPPG